MSKFNSSATTLRAKNAPQIVQNRAGGLGYNPSAKYKLVSFLLTNFLTNQFYRSGDTALSELRNLIKEVNDNEFVAKAAIYARDEFNMRSVTHVVAGELIANGEGMPKIRSFFDKVVVRPDDMMEIVAYYAANYQTVRNVSNQKKIKLPFRVKAGFRRAFNRFDDYQIAKYQKKGSDFSLVDIVNLVGPVPTEKNKASLEALVKGTLKASGTFESELSAAGQAENAEEAKNEAWATLVTTGKIGYMALVKNLRNIVQTDDSKTIDAACALLVDEKRAKGSRMLPFRLISAYFEIEKLSSSKYSRKVLQALSKASDILLSNVPDLDGETLVVIDDSGSMAGTMVANSSNTNCIDMAAVVGVTIAKKNNSDIVLFSSDARDFKYNPGDSTMSIVEQIRKICQAGGTNLSSAFDLVSRGKRKYDRIVVLSDMQSWCDSDSNGIGMWGSKAVPAGGFNAYKKALNVDPFVYSIDLAGLGTTQFRPDKVALLAGFSDKLFDIMTMCETDKNALINTIEALEI